MGGFKKPAVTNWVVKLTGKDCILIKLSINNHKVLLLPYLNHTAWTGPFSIAHVSYKGWKENCCEHSALWYVDLEFLPFTPLISTLFLLGSQVFLWS